MKKFALCPDFRNVEIFTLGQLKTAGCTGPKLVKCTGGDIGLGMATPLHEVGEGLEVFGPTTMAVKDYKGELWEVSEDDVVIVSSAQRVLVIPAEVANKIYESAA